MPTLISGLAFVTFGSIALVSGVSFIAKLSGGYAGRDPFFQFFNFQSNFVVHLLSPPFE
jgi:hypothetical protein